MANPDLHLEIKKLLVESLHLEREPESIDDGAPLFQAGLGLDSIEVGDRGDLASPLQVAVRHYAPPR